MSVNCTGGHRVNVLRWGAEPAKGTRNGDPDVRRWSQLEGARPDATVRGAEATGPRR